MKLGGGGREESKGYIKLGNLSKQALCIRKVFQEQIASFQAYGELCHLNRSEQSSLGLGAGCFPKVV